MKTSNPLVEIPCYQLRLSDARFCPVKFKQFIFSIR